MTKNNNNNITERNRKMTNSYIMDPHQRKLLKKWAPILDTGKKIMNESTKIVLA